MARWLFSFSSTTSSRITNQAILTFFSMHCHADPRSALRRQEVDNYGGNDRYAMQSSLNLTRVPPRCAFLTKSSQLMPVVQIMLTSLLICVLSATLHWKLLSRTKREHIQRYTLQRGLAPITHQSIRCPSHCDCQRHGLARRYDLQVS